MSAQPGIYQANCNSGELAPELHGRTDVKQYYSGLSLARNVEPVPQGGFRLSPRTRHLSRLRKAIAQIPAGTPTFDLGPHSSAATLVEMQLNALWPVAVILINSIASDVPVTGLIQAQTFDGTSWSDFGSPQSIGPDAKALTFALPPGEPRAGVQRVRLYLTDNPSSPATFSASNFIAYTESATVPTVRLQPFNFSRDQAYVAAIAPRLIDFFRDGVFVGSSHILFTSPDHVTYADVVQRFDTMLLFHDDMAGQRIVRDGDDGRWPRSSIPFTNIPRVDLGGTYTNAVSEQWEIRMVYPTEAAHAGGVDLYLKLNVNGEEATVYTGSLTSSWTGFATQIKNALEGLPSVANGVTVSVQVANPGLTILYVTFGGDNAGAQFSFAAEITNTALAAATVSNRSRGVPGGEALISSTAGYPACGNFFNDRLITAGFRSKRAAWLASMTGEYFDLNTKIAAANGAILINIDTEGAEEIHKIARSRHLVFFTTEGEYFVSNREWSRTQQPNVVAASRNGSARGVPIVESEGSLLYVSRNRAMIYSMTYDDVHQAYVSEPTSLLASHIVRGIVDADLEKGEVATDANRYWMVRDDGTAVIGVMIVSQNVWAFVRWETDGEVKSVCTDGANKVHLAIAREVNGATQLFLERAETGLIFDGTVEQEFQDPVSIVPNLDMHEGAEVWAKADGYVLGPFTVQGGSITLPDEFSNVSVGRWIAPDCRLLPLPNEIAEGVVLRRKKRVHTVKLDLIDTTSVAVGANDEAAHDLPLYFAGQNTDEPPPPFTGLLPVEGLQGYSDKGIVQITQTKPGWLQVAGVTVEARR